MRIKLFFLISSFNLIVPYICLPFLSAVTRSPSSTDKIHLAIGYLPNKKTNYAFKLEGSENIGSVYKISKNINDFEIDLKLNNQDVLKPNIIDEAMISLKKIF